MTKLTFSAELDSWLKNAGPKTLGSLDEKFGHKSFAVSFILLMATAALPIPTGGITHVFEAITIILALELLVGRRSIWLPKRWRKLKLSDSISKKAVPKLIGFIRWFERYSRPRWVKVPNNQTFYSVFSIFIVMFSVAAFLAPPFSGLDTLPALAVVMLGLSILLEDMLILLFGIAIGAAGIYLEVSLGSLALNLIH